MTEPTTHSLQLTIDTLADIASALVEHHETLDPVSSLNFIDHYRAYLLHCSKTAPMANAAADFPSFIIDQSLLDTAARYIAAESGEPNTIAPRALSLLSNNIYPIKVQG